MVLKRSRTLIIGKTGQEDEDFDENLVKEDAKLRDLFKIKKIIILPDDNFKERWDIFMTILLLFTAINTPYRLAFIAQDDIAWTIVDVLTDFIFASDIIINFLSAY